MQKRSWWLRRGVRLSILSLLPLAATTVGRAETHQERPPTISPQGSLLHPVFSEHMRELTTDRPDKTESPFTVDPGHFQLEMDILSYSFDRYNPEREPTRVETLSIAPLNLKVGLSGRVDAQLILQTYQSVRTRDETTGQVVKQRGFGDVIPRLKINVWGNDGGPTAFAIMPYLKLPTNQDQLGNGSLEGGLILPLAVRLPAGWDMGLMTQYDYARDTAGRGHHPEFVNSITFSHDITRRLGGYLEWFSAVSTERNSGWVGTVDFGFTYSLTRDLQLDAGMSVGVTRAAEDLNPFAGISWRF